MFLWSARTLANALEEHLPKTAGIWKRLRRRSERENSRRHFKKLYPKCENISIDYAVLEPRSAKGEKASNIFCLPADFGWNDLGSWTALHEHHVAKQRPPEWQPDIWRGHLHSECGAQLHRRAAVNLSLW